MPKRTDIESILLIGSGPIVIGQACEFDYSGTQACRVLKAEGIRVILVNSNPATIMTDPDFADRTYVEPLTPEVVARIIERERPDAALAHVVVHEVLPGGLHPLHLKRFDFHEMYFDRSAGSRLPPLTMATTGPS